MDANGLKLWRCAIVGAAIAGSYCTATAQQPPLSDAANAMIGSWEFSNADHDKICRFAFRTDASAGGYRVEVRCSATNDIGNARLQVLRSGNTADETRFPTKAPGAGPSSGARVRAKVDLPVPCRPPIAMTMDGAGSR